MIVGSNQGCVWTLLRMLPLCGRMGKEEKGQEESVAGSWYL